MPANYALALLTGILLIIIHPRFELALLAPLAIAPLLYALEREWRPKYRFLLGYVSGIVFWCGICYWIQFVMSVHGKMGDAAGTGVFILFFLIKGLHLGIFALLAGVLIRTRWALLSIPALWVAIERIPGPFYFTWLLLGDAGINMGVLLRLAPYAGVYGLSFVFALMGTAVAMIALRRPRIQLAPVFLLPLMYLLTSLPAPERGTSSAISVQPDIEDHDRWTTSAARELQQRMIRMTTPLTPASVILWPEVPAPLYYYDDGPFRESVNALARSTRTPLLMGTVAYNEQGAPLNVAAMVSSGGMLIGRYDKMFLVPFGEYVPFPFGSLTRAITNEVSDFAAGQRVMVFEVPGVRIGPFICYESAFPHLVRQFAAAGADVFANLSNDGYFGRSAAREQHLSLVRMRAAENRRWVLRSTNNGITASVDPAGRVVQRLPEFTESAGRLQYSRVNEKTPYTRYGDVFAWSCAVAAAAALFLSQLPNRAG